MQKIPVTVQINLAPGDYLLAKHLLEKQISIFSSHADEILLTVETKKSKGRFGEGWENNNTNLNNLLSSIKKKYNVIIDPIDYHSKTKKEIAKYFFDTDFIPEKDHRGGPYYCYFYGIYKAKNNIVFHLDSDIFLGGQSTEWIAEAFELHRDLSVFTTSPLPGPPAKNGTTLLKNQTIVSQLTENSYEIKGFSTRVFTINKTAFINKKLKATKVGIKMRLKSYLKKQEPYELPELIIKKFMEQHQFKRIDFLGTGLGLWSLHPPYRTADFFANVKDIVAKIDNNEYPESQIGFYDIVDELFDWSEARHKLKQNAWYRKIFLT